MITSYAIDIREKFTERDLTIELYGCNLRCRYCCSGYGRRKPPRYRGVDEILGRVLDLCERREPSLIRFTGGEFSLHGDDAINLLRRLSGAVDIQLVVETNLTSRPFWERLARDLTPRHTRGLALIVSIKHEDHVIEGTYSTEEVVENVRRLYRLLPHTYIAHGFIGFGDGFRDALFRYFPELEPLEGDIHVEREGRFQFEALMAGTDERPLYYFDQRVKRYRVSPHA